jgi:hypothetical protein
VKRAEFTSLFVCFVPVHVLTSQGAQIPLVCVFVVEENGEWSRT